jgi:D-3-phosphoglycerate dehydrogenase
MDGLARLGNVVLNPTDGVLEGPDLVRRAQGCQIVVLDRSTRMGAFEFEALPDLLAVIRCGVETRHVDLEAANAAGVLVTRTNPGYVASTAELALAHMLTASRDIPDYVHAYRDGSVRPPSHGRELSGGVAGLVGYGRIARHLTRILNAMGMTVLATDPTAAIDPPATAAPLRRILAEADFVLPLLTPSPSTANLLDDGAFAMMKPDAWLINVSRGDVVDEAALLRALDAGRIAGAAIDVGWGQDQTPSPALASHPRVYATPHIGNLTVEAAARHPQDTVLQAAEVAAGRIPFGALNADHARRLQSSL